MAKWGDISRAFNCTESNDTPNKPDTQIDEWDTMAEAARFALDQLIFKGDKLADRIEELEAKLRKSALQELSALGQASEAYQAQLAAEAKLAQQDDLVQAAVAAKLREAAEAVRSQHGDPDNENGIALAEAAILALITEDAQAALDRVVSARFGVVRSEVVRLSAEGKIDREAAVRLLAAIRKGEE